MKKASLSFVILILFSASSGHAQERSAGREIVHHLFHADTNRETTFYLQGRYARDYSMNVFGIQLKRHSEEGHIWFIKNQNVAVGFSEQGSKQFIAFDANADVGLFPVTLLLRFGAGINYTSCLNSRENILAVYPKIAFGFDSFSIEYHYKIPAMNTFDFGYSKHSLSFAYGPRIWRKQYR